MQGRVQRCRRLGGVEEARAHTAVVPRIGGANGELTRAGHPATGEGRPGVIDAIQQRPLLPSAATPESWASIHQAWP